jgi:hypothetical protein
MFTLKQQRLQESEERRGWILFLLYQQRPKPLTCTQIRRQLNALNLPTTRRTLAEELDYLRGLRMINVFPANSEVELDRVAQSKLIQAFADSESDRDLLWNGVQGCVPCARVTTAGVNFQDGIGGPLEGIARVE